MFFKIGVLFILLSGLKDEEGERKGVIRPDLLQSPPLQYLTSHHHAAAKSTWTNENLTALPKYSHCWDVIPCIHPVHLHPSPFPYDINITVHSSSLLYSLLALGSMLRTWSALLMGFPKLVHLHPFSAASNKAVKIERIHQGPPERSVILEARALDLCHTIDSEIDLVALGEESTGVEDVPHDQVSRHDGNLEDVEEPLIADDGRELLESQGVVPVDLGERKVFNNSVDGSNCDQSGAAVQGHQRRVQPHVVDPSFAASPVEGDGQGNKRDGDEDLDDQRGLDQGMTSGNLRVCQ